MKMTYTRHYLNTLDEATKAYAHWQKNAQNLIGKYGDTETSIVLREEVERLKTLNIDLIEDEASDNPKQWIERLDRLRALLILTSANKSVTGDMQPVIGDKSAKELGCLKAQIARSIRDLGGLMMRYDKSVEISNKRKSRRFSDIIQYPDKQKLLDRLHYLIDGKYGADVGAVLMNAYYFNTYLTRKPTQAEFESEFALIGKWQAITNYMNENSEKALQKANKILIFAE